MADGLFGAASFEVKVGGSELSPEAKDRLVRAEFSESLDRLDVMQLVFNVPPEEPDPVVDAIAIGKEFTIEFGDGTSTRTGYGDITELTHHYSAGDGWQLTFTGLDRLHRLRGDCHTRVFEQMKHSDLISTIAGDHGLSGQAEGVSSSPMDTFQAAETDAVFLKRLARMYNYYLRVEDNKLVFGRRNQADGEVTVTLGEDVEELSIRASVEGVVKSVTAVGWDSAAQAKVEGTKDSVKRVSGDLVSTDAIGDFGSQRLVLGSTSASDASMVDALAEAELQRRAENFVKGHVVVEGNPAAKPLAKLKIKKGPEKLQGEYIVSQVTHSLEPGVGYKTRIEFFSDGL